ncbi:MAG TPA: RnfABCDGE type electron transport complex subunit B [Ignavibacteriaceae bacterium]|nr:RnfABCDGE type electron transport complex subunit B [Ignavibacteriaceae bacterium]
MDAIVIIAVSTMGGLGLFLAGALAIADRRLSVVEDPKIGKINEVLPNANCGACGNAGCYDFAVKLVEGKAAPNGCPVGGKDVVDDISSILGIDGGDAVIMRARVLCRGGKKEAAYKEARYSGPQNCAVQALVSGGEKLCMYGCLGGGDCVTACQFNAMYMDENGLPVVIDELCTGCGLCVKACPRGIIEMHQQDRELFVICKNQDDPKTSRKVCTVSCIGCQICARKSEGGVIMENNLAIIDYTKLDISKIPLDKCSTKAIDFIRTREAVTAGHENV